MKDDGSLREALGLYTSQINSRLVELGAEIKNLSMRISAMDTNIALLEQAKETQKITAGKLEKLEAHQVELDKTLAKLSTQVTILKAVVFTGVGIVLTSVLVAVLSGVVKT